MATFTVRIFRLSNPQESQKIEISQPDRTNLAYSPKIPKGWAFQHATEKS